MLDLQIICGIPFSLACFSISLSLDIIRSHSTPLWSHSRALANMLNFLGLSAGLDFPLTLAIRSTNLKRGVVTHLRGAAAGDCCNSL